jgi:hypothetical protein
MKPVIGFTNKYYTLWEVSNPYQVQYPTYSVTKVDTNYLQNLSFDLSSAKQKAKAIYGVDVEVDDTLRGVSARSFSTEIKREYNPSAEASVFNFGKYVGSPFSEISDIEYKIWYWRQTKNSENFSQELEDELVQKTALISVNGELLPITDFETSIESRLSQLESDLFPNGHWGVNGEKVVVEGELIDSGFINSRFGGMYTYSIATDEGRYVATSSSDLPLEIGNLVKVSGTIKWVKYWSDWHSKEVIRTELKRVKVL